MNIKDELLEHIEDRTILCAKISYTDNYDYITHTYLLPMGYTPEQYENFLDSLDFNTYQDIRGYIWYVSPDSNPSWSERAEYDGTEWWEFKQCPEIPIEIYKS